MSPAHINKLAAQIVELTKRLAVAEKKIAALEKSTPPHLAKIERRGS
jgi:hypothetical protein